MGRDELVRYLRMAALDPDFCDLAATDPDRSFRGFDLDEADREALRRGGPEVLALVGRALDAAAPTPDPRPAVEVPAPPSHGTLPEVVLYLAVAPHRDEDGRLVHAASLHTELPGAEGCVRYRIRLSPSARPAADGGTALTYAAAIDPVPPASGPPPAAFGGARADDPAVRAAADAVLNAPPNARYARLLDLLRALT